MGEGILALTKHEALRTRIMISQLFEIPPDNIKYFEIVSPEEKIHFYDIPYGEVNLMVGIKEFPRVRDLAGELHDLIDRLNSWTGDSGDDFI